MMDYIQLIDKLLRELNTRVGIVDIYNKDQQSMMSEILSDWGEYDAKQIIFEFLTEKDTDAIGPETPVDYIDKKGDKQQTTYKNAMSSDKESAQYKAALKLKQNGGEPETTKDNSSVEKTLGAKSSYGKKEAERVNKVKKAQDGETTTSSEKEQEVSDMKPEELAEVDKKQVVAQIFMTKADAEQEQENVGLGTPESRAGECVTIFAGQRIQELLKEGKSFDEAREQAEIELMEKANDTDFVLTKEWVKSGLNVLDYINDIIGIDSIEHFAWDTDHGNTLVDAKGHGTSADMFVKTKDGDTLGISLKKDFKVFIVNGGYGKAMKEFESKLGLTLPENCQAKEYNKLRKSITEEGLEIVKNNRKDFEEAAEKLLSDEEYFRKYFGPKDDATLKRKRWLIGKKLGISEKAVKKLSSEERERVFKSITPKEFVDYVENGKTTGDDLKFFASLNKESSLREKFGIYTKLRNLDNDMTDNIFEFFQNNPEAKKTYKSKIIEDTHILDTLFPEKPLDDFKTIFGTDPAVEMTRKSIGSIFGVSDLMKDYENVESDDEKAKIRAQIENQIRDKLVITKKKGVPVIAINIDGPPQSKLPLYKIGVRTKGIGAAQSLEVSQETFGSLSLKNGNTNVEEWDDKDRNTVVSQESKDILTDWDDEEFDWDDLSLEQKEEYRSRVSQLKEWYPKNSKLKQLEVKLNEFDSN
jgi:hypothetical protein